MTGVSRRRFLQTLTLGASSVSFRGTTTTCQGTSGRASDLPPIIDCHAHWVGPHPLKRLGRHPTPPPKEGTDWFNIGARLRHMDSVGVQRQILSWPGGAQNDVLSPSDARRIWRGHNNDLGAVVRAYPERFSGLASLPTAEVALAADELKRAHLELGLIGAVLPLDAFVTLAGAKALSPVFAAAQTHRSHIFIHHGRASSAMSGQRPAADAEMDAYFGLPADKDTKAARDLLVEATHLATGVITLALTAFLDEYPDVTIQVATLGGTISFVMEQLQLLAYEAGDSTAMARIRRIYLDTGQSGRGPGEIAFAAGVFGADRLLFGSNSGPVSSILPTIESVKRAAIPSDDLTRIFAGNALRLLAQRS